MFVGWVCSPTQDLAAKSAAWFEIYGQVPKDLADYDDVVSFSRAVLRLVESGSLKSAEDFYRAGQLARIGYGEFKSSASLMNVSSPRRPRVRALRRECCHALGMS